MASHNTSEPDWSPRRDSHPSDQTENLACWLLHHGEMLEAPGGIEPPVPVLMDGVLNTRRRGPFFLPSSVVRERAIRFPRRLVPVRPSVATKQKTPELSGPGALVESSLESHQAQRPRNRIWLLFGPFRLRRQGSACKRHHSFLVNLRATVARGLLRLSSPSIIQRSDVPSQGILRIFFIPFLLPQDF